MPEDRAAALATIAAEVRACTLCDLHKGRTHAVPGAGNIQAEIMFIGEGPGFHEDKQGLPFVGQSGKYLSELLELIGLNREQVFITNVVKCRPPENRDPLPHEILTCKPYLDQQVAQIDPLVIATLGRYSMARYFPEGKITQIHGKPRYDNARAYYPLFHPAAVLRNPGLQQAMADDFKRLLEVLEKVKQNRAAGKTPPSSAGGDAATGGPSGNPSRDTPEEPPKQLRLF